MRTFHPDEVYSHEFATTPSIVQTGWGKRSKHKVDTFTKARELRRWIAEHPGRAQIEMPEGLRSYVGFLMKRGLIKCKGSNGRQYWVQDMAEIKPRKEQE